MEYILKYKILASRVLGVVLIIFGLLIMFWQTPKNGLTEEEKAALRVARMEASVAINSSSNIKVEDTKSALVANIKNKQEQHIRYLVIIFMILGIGLMAYSFINPKTDNSI